MYKLRRVSLIVLAASVALALLSGCAPATPAVPSVLRLATTTSTQDTGLLDYLLPDFESKFNADVQVVAVGTGQAIEIGSKGDADVLLVHDRAKEDKFVADGFAPARYDVMINDFVIVGPADDPAGIRGTITAAEAFKKIAESQSTFVSRGDDSGTNSREKAIWKEAGIEPSGDWYISAGQGMGEVLTMSEERSAYTLSDRGTYLKRQADGLKLEVLVEGDKSLLNPYGVLPVSAEKFPGVNADLSQKFVDWLLSVETQQKILDYKINNVSLFTPNSDQWNAAHP